MTNLKELLGLLNKPFPLIKEPTTAELDENNVVQVYNTRTKQPIMGMSLEDWEDIVKWEKEE